MSRLMPNIEGLARFTYQSRIYRVQYRFNDGSFLTYSQGAKDPFMVSIHRPGCHELYNLKDTDYLTWIKEWSDRIGTKWTYNMFKYVYDLVTKDALLNPDTNQYKPAFSPGPRQADFQHIEKMVERLSAHDADLTASDLTQIQIMFVCYYLVMISEFYYSGTVLFHRVKHLAVYQVLFENMPVNDAANFSRGKTAQVINQELLKCGIDDIVPKEAMANA